MFEIENIEQVASRYRSYANECVSPPVDGVQCRAIGTDGGRGVLVIVVPRGQARPHVSTAPGHHRYYRRVSDTFVPMQHYEIEEMMRLRTSPKLTLIYEMRSGGSIGNNRLFNLLFGLKNASSATAKFPYIAYVSRPNQPRMAEYGLDGNGRTLWPQLSPGSSSNVTFAAGADQVLHPKQELFVSKLDMSERHDDRFARYWGISNLADDESLHLQFNFGCEDSPMETAEIEFTKEDLLSTR